MSSIRQQIQDAAPRNRELLATLAQTDHASPALAQQNRYIADLDGELRTLAATSRKLDAQRKKELKEHERYRDSVVKRLAFKVSRRAEQFEARAAKEEREYFDVLQQAQKTGEQQKATQALRDEADAARKTLQADVARHADAQSQLDSLYDSIFGGANPDFAGEDAVQARRDGAQGTYERARAAFEEGAQAVRTLEAAQGQMGGALASIEDALAHSRYDMFGGGAINDMMERNCLQRAEMQLGQAGMLVSQARRASPLVREMPAMRVAQGSLVSDVFFDNIFTDMAFHDKIKESRAEVLGGARHLEGEVAAARDRARGLEADVAARAAELEGARAELQRVRAGIFEGGGEGQGQGQVEETGQAEEEEAAPPYERGQAGAGGAAAPTDEKNPFDSM